MTIYSDVNSIPATGSVALFQFKQLLKSAGWKVMEASDGTTLVNYRSPLGSKTGGTTGADQITHGGAGAGGLANYRAWYSVQDPSGLREFVVQRHDSNNQQWRVMYSMNNGFVTPGTATQTSTAGDNAPICGGGAATAPTFGNLFQADGSYRLHIVTIAPADPCGVFPFFLFTHYTGAAALQSWLFCESMGTYSALDADPCVLGSLRNDLLANNMNSHAAQPCKAWYRLGLSGGGWGTTYPHTIGVYNPDASMYAICVPAFSYNFGANPYDTMEEGFPIVWGRTNYETGLNGIKGLGKNMLWKCNVLAYPNTFDLASANARVVAGHCLLPWPTGVVPLL